MSNIPSIPELTQPKSGHDVNNLANFLTEGASYTASIVNAHELPDGKTWLLPIRVNLGIHMAEAVLISQNWIPKQGDKVEFTKPIDSSILRATLISHT